MAYWVMANEAIIRDMTEKLKDLEDKIGSLQTKIASSHGREKVALREKLEELYEQRKIAQRRLIDVT